MNQHIVILCPVFNDSESLAVLARELDMELKQLPGLSFTMLVVNDGSAEKPVVPAGTFFDIQLIHLYRNIGHQKALAVGLSFIREQLACDKVLVMDTDGEDRPADAVALLRLSLEQPEAIVFAHRTTRQENRSFLFFYWLYKLSFRLLTGRKIAFGNFMVLPQSSLNRIVYYSEIWSHLAGGILKSGMSFTSLPTHRGKRYAGHSKMSFQHLLIHGLGAISVFMEVIASRLLIFSFGLIGFSLLVILGLGFVKAFTDLAIPGWTSTVMSSMLVVLLQSFLLSLFTLFLYFSSESQRKLVPALHYRDYMDVPEKVS